jgi:hypothetical protein
LKKGYEVKMKYHRSLTLLDTYRAMITKVVMIKTKLEFFLLNIKINVPKCLKIYVKDETWL